MTRGIYIVIAVGRISTYLELAGQLNELGLVEFDDYIYYKWLDKKLVLLHGNCHMHIIKSYLESSNKFAEKYEFYPNPLICNNKEGKIADKVFDYCDLWIHEDIQEDNEYGYLLSDVYIRGKWLGGGNYNKKEIIIPHLFGMGNAFFPQAAWNRRNEAINNAKEKNGMFPHADIIIDKCVEKGMKVEDIIAFCKGDSALERNVIIDNFNKYMDKIKKREKAWDIKIYDFIMENYKKNKLFYDGGHPANIIFKRICIDILREINIVGEDLHTNIFLDDFENPVYPTVKKCLKLEWNEYEIRKSQTGRKMCDHMDFDEYIREYLWWSFGI